EVPVTVKVVTPDADKYTPEAREQTVRPGGTPRATVAIANLQDLPQGTKVGFKTPVDTSTEGDKQGTVVVTYPDGSKEDVPVIVKVVAPDADKYTPAGKTQTVKPNETPQAVNSIENASSLPEGTQYAFKAPVNTSSEGDKSAVVVVTYPDGTRDEVPVTVKVVTPDADKYTP
ncbi:Rib/alpha-like domain-containing protein, partial [Streptococcus danieliae]